MHGELQSFTVIALALLGFGLISRRLERSVLTPPMVFVMVGLAFGPGLLGWAHISPESEAIRLIAELTLVLLLFTDASRIDFKALKKDFQIPMRLLLIGMPLTIFLGAVAARLIFKDFTLLEALILATVLAPTDAALGQAVVSSKALPVRVRQALNVESGLNDGIAVPVLGILIGIASMMGEAGMSTADYLSFTADQLFFGPLVGVIVGLMGSGLIVRASDRDWMSHEFQQLAGMSLAVLAFAGASLVGGNGLIAAFCAGLTIGNSAPEICHHLFGFAEIEGQLLALLTFLVFGAVLVWPAITGFTTMALLYAILSLTVVRMLPVALSLIGLKLHLNTMFFLGWFGPRGLASILFGLLVLEDYAMGASEEIFAVTGLTVLLSVFLHGLTAQPGARWYAAHSDRSMTAPHLPDRPEHLPGVDLPVRLPDKGESSD